MQQDKENPSRLESLQINKPESQLNLGTYTRFIQIMRIILPIGLVILIAVLFTWPQFQESIPHIEDSDLSNEIARAENVLTDPRFESLDNAMRPYVVTAERAALKGLEQGDIVLESPKGWMTLSNSRTLNVEADGGIYNQKDETLSLKSNVIVTHSNGYTMKTQTLFADLKEGLIRSDTPVELVSGENYLSAPSLVMTDEGDHIQFQGPVKLLFLPEKKSDTKNDYAE